MQKIEKILRAVLEKGLKTLHGQPDGWTEWRNDGMTTDGHVVNL